MCVMLIPLMTGNEIDIWQMQKKRQLTYISWRFTLLLQTGIN